MSREHLTSCADVGVFAFLSAEIRCGSGVVPFSEKIWTKKLSDLSRHWHLLGFKVRFFAASLERDSFSAQSCSSLLYPTTMMSSAKCLTPCIPCKQFCKAC